MANIVELILESRGTRVISYILCVNYAYHVRYVIFFYLLLDKRV